MSDTLDNPNAVRVQMPEIESKAAKKENSKFYLVGCYWNPYTTSVSIGITFPFHSVIPGAGELNPMPFSTERGRMEINNSAVPGEIIELSDKKVEQIKERARHLYYRVTNYAMPSQGLEILDTSHNETIRLAKQIVDEYVAAGRGEAVNRVVGKTLSEQKLINLMRRQNNLEYLYLLAEQEEVEILESDIPLSELVYLLPYDSRQDAEVAQRSFSLSWPKIAKDVVAKVGRPPGPPLREASPATKELEAKIAAAQAATEEARRERLRQHNQEEDRPKRVSAGAEI